MTVPVYSVGVMMVAESIGSSMWSMRLASGSSVGLSTSSSVPSVRKARYSHRAVANEREVELPLEALGHDLHVQQPGSRREADPEGVGRLGLEGEAGVG